LSLYLEDDQGLHVVAPGVVGSGASKYFDVSSDGRYALFSTTAALDPGDDDGHNDVYRYDAVSGNFTWVSAGLGGSGNGEFDASIVSGPVGDLGQRALFETAEQLVPGDQNELPDVYEWSPAGPALITAGTPDFHYVYLGGTADNGTVLFSTSATLLPRDRDGGEGDIYAARLGGGFAEPSEGPRCEVQSCAELPVAQPSPRLKSGDDGKRRLELARIDAATRRQLAATGSTSLLAETPSPGQVSAEGRARIGGRRQIVASGSAAAKKAGPVPIRLRLSAAAQSALAGGEKLKVDLVLRQRGQRPSPKVEFNLGAVR
jgi:hypothetical protein